MKKTDAKKIIDKFKKSRFKCIVPDIVIEAMETLGIYRSECKRLKTVSKSKR
jgi:rRNA-processing protein FCF1